MAATPREQTEVQRLKSMIRAMAQAWADQSKERDAEMLELIHENDRLRAKLAARETVESEAGE